MAAPITTAATAPPIAAAPSSGSGRRLGSDGGRKVDAGLSSTKRHGSRQAGSTGPAPSATLPKADTALAVGATIEPAGGFKHQLDVVTANFEARTAAAQPGGNTSVPHATKRNPAQRAKRRLGSSVSPPAVAPPAAGIQQLAASSLPLPATPGVPPPVMSATQPTLSAKSASVAPTGISQRSPVGDVSVPVATAVQSKQTTLLTSSEPSARPPIPASIVDSTRPSIVEAAPRSSAPATPAAVHPPSSPMSSLASASQLPTTAPGGGLTASRGGFTLAAVTRAEPSTPSALEISPQVSKAAHQPAKATSDSTAGSLLSASVVSAQTTEVHSTLQRATIPALPVPAAPEGATAPPAQQVLAVLSPILRTSDGTHRISLELQPAELGSIQATVTVSAGKVTVELHADNAATRQAIGSALPDLRHQLGSGGQQAHVFFGSDAPRRQIGYSDRRLGVTSAPSAGAQPTQILIPSAKSASSVDIRL